jgi:hypothetical protein
LQADRRALNITLNSIGTELTRDDRRKLYANFGMLYPHGQVSCTWLGWRARVGPGMHRLCCCAQGMNLVELACAPARHAPSEWRLR